MQSISVQTAQNVNIGYETAGVGDRILAFLIDIVIMVAYGFTMIWILSQSGIESTAVMIATYLPIFFYHLILEVAFNGQSLGKMALEIRVIKKDGAKPTLGGYILRWIARIVDIALSSGGVAILIIVLGGEGQRLGDMAAGTTVVKLRKRIVVKSHEILANLDDDHKVTFSEVLQLKESDIKLIQEALKMRRKLAKNEPVIAITNRIKDILKVQSDMPDVKFLYTIIKDFEYLTSKV